MLLKLKRSQFSIQAFGGEVMSVYQKAFLAFLTKGFLDEIFSKGVTSMSEWLWPAELKCFYGTCYIVLSILNINCKFSSSTQLYFYPDVGLFFSFWAI